jgi:hypothetical protein
MQGFFSKHCSNNQQYFSIGATVAQQLQKFTSHIEQCSSTIKIIAAGLGGNTFCDITINWPFFLGTTFPRKLGILSPLLQLDVLSFYLLLSTVKIRLVTAVIVSLYHCCKN